MRPSRTLAALTALAALVPANAMAQTVEPAGRVQARVATPAGAARPPARRPLLRPLSSDPLALAAAKQAAAERRARRSGTSPPTETRAAVSEGLNQPGMDADDGGGATPPDTTGAIGPSHYVEMVNVAVAVYSRSSLGLVSGPLDLETFMAAPEDTLMTDPQVIWDQQTGRWFYLGLAVTLNPITGTAVGPNFLQYGFSKSSDPSDLQNGWCRYSLPNGKGPPGNQDLIDDYPKLGDDDGRAIFGTNAFNEDGDFLTARIWSVPKPPAGALSSCPAPPAAVTFGAPGASLRTSDNDMAFTPVPASTADRSGEGYVVAADDPLEGADDPSDPSTPRSQIMAWHLAGAAFSPALVPDGSVGVASYDVPAPARQPGATELDTLDARLTMAVGQADPDAGGARAVWTQHAVDPGDGTVVTRWYELLPSSLAARQQGTIADPANDVYNAALSPTTAGNFAAIFYNRSGPTLAPEIRGTFRGPATPPSVTIGDFLLGSSSAPAADFSCTSVCRWGDYSGASPDHSNPLAVWGSNQAVAAPGGPMPSWITRNFVLADEPPSASFGFSPATPGTGQAVTFSSSSSDPDGGVVTQSWDLDGDGQFDDASGATASRTYTRAGAVNVGLRVTDPEGAAGVATRAVTVLDRTPPRLRILARRSYRTRSVTGRRGLRFRVRSNEPARLGATLVISRRTARRLRLVSRRYRRRTFTVGRGTARLRRAGTRRVVLRISRRARRRLRGARRVTTRLVVRGTDEAGNTARVSRRIVLRR